ncbi:HAMP domain-containing sensor histidine kinase [Nocardioides sp. SYSU D00038]|uniref:sensor histidine kinase n=1 Tax=Nocardioides sp. SYSU D00038 TaxID=2812554 RepID=UPI0027DD6AB7|nr:HAMP domain-containing sensor histidine kinase [Nocardioides sp. SYSU D00038]
MKLNPPTAETPVDSRWHYRRSLASRVTLLTTMAVGLSVAFVAIGAYVTVRMQLSSTLDETLLDRAHQTAKAPTLVNLPTGDEVPAWALVATDLRIALVFSDGRVYEPGQTKGVPRMSGTELEVAAGKAPQSLRTVRTAGYDYRVVAVPYGDDQALVIAQSLESQEKVLTRLGLVTLLFGLAGIIAAGVAGWGVARNGLRPVRKLSSAVEEIARTEDLRPLPVEGDDEIARLATAFNQMLTSLAASRDRQRRLVADAGHELRTPLTSLRTNIDLLTMASPENALPPEAHDELLADVRAQIEELTTLVGDLVELARDEPLTHVVGQVEVHEALEQAVARVRRRAGDVRIALDNASWFVVGEAGSIERALTNLLDNAVKWSPPGAEVRVRMDSGVVTVDDDGPGIPDEDLPHVFERFYRSEASRSMPGSGLGLSIVHQIVERHAGTVEAQRRPEGGTRMVLRLPGSAVRP